MYSSVIEALTGICQREIGFDRVYFCFAQNTIHDFWKYRIEVIVALSLTDATKMQQLMMA